MGGNETERVVGVREGRDPTVKTLQWEGSTSYAFTKTDHFE